MGKKGKIITTLAVLIFAGIVAVGTWQFDNIKNYITTKINASGSFSTTQPINPPKPPVEPPEEVELEAGLYSENELVKSWQALKDEGYITVTEGVLDSNYSCEYNFETKEYVKNLNLEGNLVISDEVTQIADRAFSESTYYTGSDLTGIVIPNTVTTIGANAFDSCKINELVIPESVTVIGNGAFTGNKFVSLFIPTTVTEVGVKAFSSCKLLTTVTGMTGLTSISNGMFTSCSELTDVSLPQNITSIGSSAFSSCSKLEVIEIPNKVSSLGSSCFSKCTLLSSVILPNSLTGRIESYTFSECNSLVSIDLPNGITEIGSSAFNKCQALKKIKFPTSLTKIENNAFSKCTALDNVFIPLNVYNIATDNSSTASFDMVDSSQLHKTVLYFEAQESNFDTFLVTRFKSNYDAKFGYTYEQYLSETTFD